MLPNNHISNNTIKVYTDAFVFSKDTISKCLYWYSDKFRITIELVDNKYYNIELNPLSNNSYAEEILKNYLLKLERDLIDFNLRDIITKETQNVRDLLIAKAFSHYNTEEKPPGDFNDRIGIQEDMS